MNYGRHRGYAGSTFYAPRSRAEEREELELIRKCEEQRLERCATTALPKAINQDLSTGANSIGSTDTP